LGRASSFDQPAIGSDLVGAVDGEIEAIGSAVEPIERVDAQAEVAGELFGSR
jgi:hypothetical protein